ncbi:iron-sulfur cluster repair di-iron protein ScdA [Staphylococcus hominis]|uniref:Iron-sulfur cluster repair di-iron protein ScdA n=1 Tax=Staphylococcus hominis TaxID=1290 RepID=A0A974KXE7_STAHO|nr:iron-sulfur cluster repair di-iron protein ScdA [Staphylococcus hominis]
MIIGQDIVADVVTDYPKTADIFRSVGIDFYCGGNESIEKVVGSKKNVDLKELLNELNQIDFTDISNQLNPKYLSIPSLIQYIQTAYHEPMKEEFKNSTPYITKLIRVHGSQYPYLLDVQKLYQVFKNNMLEHTQKEDTVDFPKIIEYSNGQKISDIENIIANLIPDHENTRDILNNIRRLTFDFQLPSDACKT